MKERFPLSFSKKKKSRFIAVVCYSLLALLVTNCTNDFNQARDKREANCRNIFLANWQARQLESQLLPRGEFILQFSCSSEGTTKPSCFEEYNLVRDATPKICPQGMVLGVGTCSRQNLVGVCRKRSTEPGRATLTVYALPLDTWEEASVACQDGVLTRENRTITQRERSEEALLLNGYLCFNR